MLATIQGNTNGIPRVVIRNTTLHTNVLTLTFLDRDGNTLLSIPRLSLAVSQSAVLTPSGWAVMAADGTPATSGAFASGVFTGAVSVGTTLSVTGATDLGSTLTGTSASASALTYGPNGATNPTFKVISNVSSQAGGVSVGGGADAIGGYIRAIGSNTNEPLLVDGKGSGPVTIGSVSTGGTVVYTKVATVATGGNAISNANAVTPGYTYVTGGDGAGNTAVALPASVVGKVCTLKNASASALVLFPPVSSQINAKGVNAAYNIPANAERQFTCVTTTLWYGQLESIT